MGFADWFSLVKEGGALALLALVLFSFSRQQTIALNRLARIMYRMEGKLGLVDEGTPPPRNRRNDDNP
jgi:hypothetical protein